MATHDSSKATGAATLGKKPVPCHQYDNWLMPSAGANADALFASRVIDVSRGAKTIASILASHLVDLEATADGDDTTKPLLSPSDTDALARLAVFSLQQLHDMAVNQVDRLNTASEARGRA